MKSKEQLRERDANGYLKYRCNRCGRELTETNTYIAGNEPICVVCSVRITSEQEHKRDAGKLTLIRRHRQQYYVDAVNKLIDGKADVAYVQQRWDKYKQVRRKHR